MRVVDKEELNIYKKEFFNKINNGMIFIHPTDTIYGLGCDATNQNAVQKLRDAKNRMNNPFSVIAPSKEWIKTNCEISEKNLSKFPGSVTLILKLKNNNAIAKNVNNCMKTLGVRMPEHWISNIVKELGIPIVTTSVNKQGEEFMIDLDSINPEIQNKVDFTIYEGRKVGKPSKIINTVSDEVIERKSQ